MSKTANEKLDLVFTDSTVVKSYIQYRPTPPESLINRILEFTREKRTFPLRRCLDVGCGSGQNTVQFASFFDQVIGIDVSQEQLKIARDKNRFRNVSYKEGTAECLVVEDKSVDLVTACAAIHWFNFENFYAEVDRVLKPGGVLACYSYLGCSPLYAGQNFRKEFMEIADALNPYWAETHYHLRNEYATLPACYEEDVHLKGFSVETDASLDILMGYVSSWSAFPKMKKDKGEDAANKFLGDSREKLKTAMAIKEEDTQFKRRYDYFLRLWRKSGP